MYKKQIFDLSYLVQKKFGRDLKIFLKVRETNEMNIKMYLIMREIIEIFKVLLTSTLNIENRISKNYL